METITLTKPTHCMFWKKPRLSREDFIDAFEVVEVYKDESHFMRSLKKCKECEQLYYTEFYEVLDAINGNDAQYSTYVPVISEQEIEMLNSTDHIGLLNFFPRLQYDFPTNATDIIIGWNGKDE